MLSGFLVGAAVTAGGLSIFVALALRPGQLADRVLPYVATRDIQPRWQLQIRRLANQVLTALGSTRESVATRVEMLGEETITGFRLRQLQWAGAGALAGVLLALALLTRGNNPVLGLLCVIAGALGGALGADSDLSRRVERRSQTFTRELPDVVELLALAVASGESIRVALERVSRIGTGDLVREISRLLDAVNAGEPLPTALTAFGVRSQNRNVSRFADAVVSALEQGSGLAATLHAQAQDTREAARRELLEKGGKAEIYMMMPVVFLILPVTILFTIYPGLQALQLG
ncbi:MAG: type II secretion system F family protein [Trueperella sp.]|nr:type II secretion system F family protein [Trueperella sp.]